MAVRRLNVQILINFSKTFSPISDCVFHEGVVMEKSLIVQVYELLLQMGGDGILQSDVSRLSQRKAHCLKKEVVVTSYLVTRGTLWYRHNEGRD